MFFFNHSKYFFTKFILSSVLLNIIFFDKLISQIDTNEYSFSISEIEFSTTPKNIFFLNSNNDLQLDLLTHENNSLSLFISDSTGNFIFKKVILESSTISEVKAKDLNFDNKDEIILTHRSLNKLQIIFYDSLFNFKSFFYDVNFYPDKILILDFNNDNYLDICTFGKSSSGISILTGKKNGKFNNAEILFSEIPISDVFAINLNRDIYIDLAVKNWLTNEIIYYLGLGDLGFYVYDEMNLKSEENQLFFLKAKSSLNSDLIITNNNKLSYFQTNNLGKTTEYFSLKTKSKISFIDTITFKNIENRFILISLNNGDFELINYDVSNDSLNALTFNLNNEKVLVNDLNGDGQNEIILLDKNKLNILWINSLQNSQNLKSLVLNKVKIPIKNLTE